ncbi:hypothetical protein DOK78_001930 [Enterococcus sp. DIV2402]|uniref:Adenylyl-sulfate kinase n=1 Tax=Candidatus Enterococcus lowellii TaxID=2230877 RepID=A0ABZ2SP57_9ENTE|nr:adenylyl-sulfate kinase [Enterococcus sp. DIV2402]MBO0463938.1 adenylyl-sulfate kinase [Enterococcus sp. DIV2402]
MKKVLVFSSITGGGKTTLIQKLAVRIENCVVISFDDYSIDALPSAPPLDTPIEDAINQYELQQLMDDFLNIPDETEIVLIDFPFGNRHEVLAPYIDTTFYIQTPLDIALARQILRDFSAKTQKEILEWAATYLNFARPIFVNHEAYVSETADIILEGTASIEDNVQIVLESLEENA